MNLLEMLGLRKKQIIESTIQQLRNTGIGAYENDSYEENCKRIENLFNIVSIAIEDKTVKPMQDYSEEIAKQRFFSGFNLQEVLTAYNFLEQAIWKDINQYIKIEEISHNLAVLSTVLGAGKQALGICYVSLACDNKVDFLNLSGVFEGV